MIYGNVTSEAPRRIVQSARRYSIIAPCLFFLSYTTLIWSLIWRQYQETFGILYLAALAFNSLINSARFLYMSQQMMRALADLDRSATVAGSSSAVNSPLMVADIRAMVLGRLRTMRKMVRFQPLVVVIIPTMAAAWPMIRHRMSYIVPGTCMPLALSRSTAPALHRYIYIISF
jgi:hypothetical protein